jgi:hypothetical protein
MGVPPVSKGGVMKKHTHPVDGQTLVVTEETIEDLIEEREAEYSRPDPDIDLNDPRLTSEPIEIDPEMDAYKPYIQDASIKTH